MACLLLAPVSRADWQRDDKSPWYLINSPTMHFACAAILAPKPLTMPAGGKLELNYRLIVSRDAWTVDRLRTAYAEWLAANHSAVPAR